MPFCVSGVLNVLAHGRRGSFWQYINYDSAFPLMHDAFNRNSGSYQCFGIYFLSWDHLYLTYCSPRSFPWVLRYHPLDTLGVKWMEPQHSILDSLDPVYLAGIKQDFNAHRDFEKTARLEEIQTATHSMTAQTCLPFLEILVFLK